MDAKLSQEEKLALTLNHGQESVEREFSVNDTITDNMTHELIIAKHCIINLLKVSNLKLQLSKYISSWLGLLKNPIAIGSQKRK